MGITAAIVPFLPRAGQAVSCGSCIHRFFSGMSCGFLQDVVEYHYVKWERRSHFVTQTQQAGRVYDMKCPYCGFLESKVIDSRSADEGSSIRRRRECLGCQRRFTTYEIMERLPLVVVKRDGSRQTFDKNKLVNSMLKSCEKRSVELEQLEDIATDIEQNLQSALEREIPTSEIGEMVMARLKELDEVAYVRFASVYRQFKDINTFMEELTKLLEDKG